MVHNFPTRVWPLDIFPAGSGYLSGARTGYKELTFLKIKLEIERRFLSLEAHQASHTQARVRSLLLQHKPSTSYLLKCCGTLATSQSLWIEAPLQSVITQKDQKETSSLRVWGRIKHGWNMPSHENLAQSTFVFPSSFSLCEYLPITSCVPSEQCLSFTATLCNWSFSNSIYQHLLSTDSVPSN